MAFLCPSRIWKQRKKRGRKDPTPPLPGRITGSASIDTLVRVGLEKEEYETDGRTRPQMVVLHDFVPCVEDELAVRRGQRITILYQENDWVYVLGSDGREGFIPSVYCVPLGRSIDDLHVATKKVRPANDCGSVYEKTSEVYREYRDFGEHSTEQTGDPSAQPPPPQPLERGASRSMPSINTNADSSSNDDPHNSSDTPLLLGRDRKVSENTKADPHRDHVYSNPPLAHTVTGGGLIPLGSTDSVNSSPSSELGTFHKEAKGRYIVLFSFMAVEEGDLCVKRGEFVTVLNRDDPDWFWVVRSDQSEGFVPSNFLVEASGPTPTCEVKPPSSKSVAPSPGRHPAQYHPGTEQTLVATPENVTELVVLYDYCGQAADDVTVTRGEWVWADMTSQPEEGWLWVYVMATGTYGFIPSGLAKPPSIVRNTTTRLSNVDRTLSRPSSRASSTVVNTSERKHPLDPYLSP